MDTHHHDATPSDRRILRMAEVEARVGLGRSRIYRLIKEGDFPRAVPLTERTVGWIASEVDDWIEGRVRRRDQAA